jgi:hypothetical protein
MWGGGGLQFATFDFESMIVYTHVLYSYPLMYVFDCLEANFYYL